MDDDKASLLNAIVEGSPYAKILVDERGLISLVNAQAEKLFGWSREDLLGESIDVLVPERFRRGHAALRDLFHTAPSARPMGAGRELFGRRKDGTEIPIEIGLNPIRTGGGTFTLAAISDITERKRVEELRLLNSVMQQHAAEVEELNRELAEASRFKSQFVATMSHELRTPLTAIIGAAELLASEPLGERGRFYANTINESAEGLLALTNSILDYSKIESGGFSLRLKGMLIESVVEGTAEAVAHIARDKGITLYTDVAPGIPPVQGDADCLRQIMLNLLGNAVKFTAHGQVVARVLPVATSDNGVTLRFEVEDSGIGISAEDLERLFQPFVQAESPVARRFGGTGLGLSICKRLTELMDGEIGVRSEPGAGSVFWFEVPFKLAIEAVPSQSRSLDGVAVLLLSDDGLFAQIVERYSMSWLMKFRSAKNAVEVLRALESEVESWVAIIDQDALHGPEMVRAERVARALLRDRVIAIGGDAALRKPIRQSYLFDAIVNACSMESAATPAARRARDADRLAPPPLPVLVAEDSVRLQPLLALQFEQLGIPAHIVSNGREAVDALLRDSYSMVFMDCQMPEMDGFTATRAIRERETLHGSHVPIVAMTADAFAEDRDACLAAGMDDYLPKPVKLADLRATIERWSKNRAATS
jgi:PAS domain S-box-containing protein